MSNPPMSVYDAAVLFGVSPSRVRVWVQQGLIPATRDLSSPGRPWVLDAHKVHELLENATTERTT
jgi:excisionase family DNA binding protein